MEGNLISVAIEIVGLKNLAMHLCVTYQAVRKWEKKGRLPRTEWTGETNYAERIEKLTCGKVSKAILLSVPAVNGAENVEAE
jgi:hypothetical protein